MGFCDSFGPRCTLWVCKAMCLCNSLSLSLSLCLKVVGFQKGHANLPVVWSVGLKISLSSLVHPTSFGFVGFICRSQLIYLQMPCKTCCPNGREGVEENHHLMLRVCTSLFPVHPLLHLIVYICFIVYRFVNNIFA